MARLNERFSEEELARKDAFVKGENMKELKVALSRFGISDVPNAIINFMNEVTLPRVGSVSFGRFDFVADNDSLLFGEAKDTSVFGRLVKKEGKAFPHLLLYAPSIARTQDVQLKEAALRRVVKSRAIPENRLKAIVDALGLDAYSEQILLGKMAAVASGDVISNEMMIMLNTAFFPEGLPDQIKIDGSQARMHMLASKSDSQIFEESDNVMCVIHTLTNNDGTPCKVWTFYVHQLDPVVFMINRLASVPTNLPIELAVKIASVLSNDQYYRVENVSYDARTYASDVAFHAGFSIEDENAEIKDLLQGPVKVFVSNGKCFVDIDDEMPSAFLIKGHLNIYMPKEPAN